MFNNFFNVQDNLCVCSSKHAYLTLLIHIKALFSVTINMDKHMTQPNLWTNVLVITSCICVWLMALAIPLHRTMKTGIACSVVNGLRIWKEDRNSIESRIWNLLNHLLYYDKKTLGMKVTGACGLQHKKTQYAFYGDLFLCLCRFNSITRSLHIIKVVTHFM